VGPEVAVTLSLGALSSSGLSRRGSPSRPTHRVAHRSQCRDFGAEDLSSWAFGWHLQCLPSGAAGFPQSEQQREKRSPGEGPRFVN
jgi:hypothetical protein